MPDDLISRRRIARGLRRRRAAIIAALRDGRASGLPRENRFGDEPAQFDQRIGTWVDLLIGYLEGHSGYDALLAGQTVLEIHRPDLDASDNRAATNNMLDATWSEIEASGGLDSTELAALKTVFDDLVLGMRTESRTHVRTLLIGDCLMAEIAGLAADRLARIGISFDPFPLNGRNVADLDRQIVGMPTQGFDAIFFSPFSHARLAEIDALLDPRRLLAGAKVDRLVASIIAQTEPILRYLEERFECPVYVHNAGLVARASTSVRALVRNGVSAHRRTTASERLNDWLAGFIAARDASGPRQLQLIDEAAIVRRLGSAAGRYLYQSDFQHATRLSLELASDYARRIEMLATLKGRKLVICDLDNTLWDGVIGEGAVSHFADRQHVLRRLRQGSGVVLTIASKNDPGNVHFEGGVLGLDDFVAPQISWGRKVDAVAKLRQQLNLQYCHMVFLDDRPDERAFVAEAYPEIQVIDSSDPESWGRIGLWADISEGSSDLDRTQLYREQLQRDALVGDDRVSNLQPDLIAELELRVGVREATRADLKRFVELINRTNQWNLTGARTNMANAQGQASDPGSLLLLASARDKFGDMGDVCAASVSIVGDEATIDAFVLSCRVFGYGVETAMIESICAKAAERGAKRLCGRFVPTTQNQMARSMYVDHGFTPEADGLFSASLDVPARTARAG